MISLKKYLDSADIGPEGNNEPDQSSILSEAIEGCRSVLREMGSSSMEALPALVQN